VPRPVHQGIGRDRPVPHPGDRSRRVLLRPDPRHGRGPPRPRGACDVAGGGGRGSAPRHHPYRAGSPRRPGRAPSLRPPGFRPAGRIATPRRLPAHRRSA